MLHVCSDKQSYKLKTIPSLFDVESGFGAKFSIYIFTEVFQ